MRSTPLVSILLPVHNAERTLGPCLDSLATARRGSMEIVAVDDGSTDASAALIQRFAHVPCRLLQPGRVGLIKALNLGLKACRGQLVARMDADDLCPQDRVQHQMDALLTQPLDVVSGMVQPLAQDARCGEGYETYCRWLNGLDTHCDIVRERFVESPVAHPSVMFWKDSVAAVGGYRDVGWPEDYDLWLRLIEAGARFGKVSAPVLQWRDAPDRHSRTHKRYSQDAFLRCKAHFLARGPLRISAQCVVWGAGKVGKRLARYLRAEGVSVSNFIDIDLRKIGNRIAGAAVLSPKQLPSQTIVTAVGTRGARELIRDELNQRGRVAGVDYWCAA